MLPSGYRMVGMSKNVLESGGTSRKLSFRLPWKPEILFALWSLQAAPVKQNIFHSIRSQASTRNTWSYWVESLVLFSVQSHKKSVATQPAPPRGFNGLNYAVLFFFIKIFSTTLLNVLWSILQEIGLIQLRSITIPAIHEEIWNWFLLQLLPWQGECKRIKIYLIIFSEWLRNLTFEWKENFTRQYLKVKQTHQHLF